MSHCRVRYPSKCDLYEVWSLAAFSYRLTDTKKQVQLGEKRAMKPDVGKLLLMEKIALKP